MKTIRISDEVWDEIAKLGKFGETPDDVLRRVFNIKQGSSKGRGTMRQRQATQRVTPEIRNEQFIVSFESGASKKWILPSREDKRGIRKLTDETIKFAEQHNATVGQVNYVRKVLTDAGYHITK